MTATDKACQHQNLQPILDPVRKEIKRQERRLVCAMPGSEEWREALQQLHRLSEQL